jgi:hypothetical protein
MAKLFEGGQASDFQFVVGEGQMLKEFEEAVNMKTGESKTFPLSFPADYHGKDVAGKTADFMVSLKKIESSQLPELNEAFVKSLGVATPTVEGLKADIEKNLQREVKSRLLSKISKSSWMFWSPRQSLIYPSPLFSLNWTAWLREPVQISRRGITRMLKKPPFLRTSLDLRLRTVCAWVWWSLSWSAPTTCMPSLIKSRSTLSTWPPVTKSRRGEPLVLQQPTKFG